MRFLADECCAASLVQVLRLDPSDHDLKIVGRLDRRLIADYGDRLVGHYSVVGRDRFRFRPLANPLL